MTDNFPPEEKDLCTSCTIEDCTQCPYPSSAGDESLIYSNADFIVDPNGVAYTPYVPPQPAPQLPASISEPQPPPAPLPVDPKTIQLDFSTDSKPRGRGRPKKEVDPSIQKRKPGAQPGNLNALRHGLYVQGNAIFNTTPMERAKLYDFTGMITHLKNYFDTTYQNGQKLKKTFEINDTMRVLSSATIALSRAINTQQLTTVSWLPDALREKGKNTPLKKIEDYYRNKVQYLDTDLAGGLDGGSPGETEKASDPAPEAQKEE